ncbi:MAG: hypothetical protein L3J96_02630 [Thermoplasmata archaeon]|nr:hypothetical protein [Thermoplasmata archaeon]
MVRSILAIHRVRTAHRRGELEVEGLDEDGLTLVVHALEKVGDSEPGGTTKISRLHLVGDLSDRWDWAIREALGLPHLEIHHHLPGPASLFASLHQAGQEPADGAATCVVAVDVSRPSMGVQATTSGGGAIAFVFGDGRGTRMLGHGQRAHPLSRRPNATEWSEAAVRGAGEIEDAGSGVMLLLTDAAPPVLEATWTRLHPKFPAHTEPLPAGYGTAPTLGVAHRVAELISRLPLGEAAVIARVETEQTHYLGVRADSAVKVDLASAEGVTLAASGPSNADLEVDLLRVSEGAYVPYASYRENLPSRWRFVADRCGACGRRTFPVRQQCRYCGERKQLTAEELPRAGLVVESITTVRPGAQPTEFDLQVGAGGPYDVALVRLAPEVRVTLQLTDHTPGETKIGTRVTSRLRRLYPMEGEWRYGRKGIPDAPRLVVPGAQP